MCVLRALVHATSSRSRGLLSGSRDQGGRCSLCDPSVTLEDIAACVTVEDKRCKDSKKNNKGDKNKEDKNEEDDGSHIAR